MAWRPHSRASVDPENPACWGTCDRCGLLYNLNRLHFQHQWSGSKLLNLRLLVCDRCLDIPAAFLRTLVLPPDPPPIFNARPEPYSIDEASPPFLFPAGIAWDDDNGISWDDGNLLTWRQTWDIPD